MPDKVHDGTPLGLVDTAWLHMEDPTNLMMVTGMFLLDGPLGVDELRETLRERMVQRFPRLRHRGGVASDRGLVPDPESIAEAFEAEYRAMRAWVARRARPAKAPRPGGRPATRRSGAGLGAG